MRTLDTFKQYCWLINTIYRNNRISLKRIEQLWLEYDLNNGSPLSRPTFIRLKEAVEDMFGIIIKCERKNGYQYYISNPEILKDNSTQNWMLQTLTVGNILVDSLAIKDRLVLEEIPGGLEYLQTIIKAIKTNLVLMMTHQGFDSPTPKTIAIEPYCLKVFRQRWYLLGKNYPNASELRIYALDRIIKLEETSQTFAMDLDFDASDFFNKYFGVFIGEKEEPVRIVIRAYGHTMVSLLRTLPKHHSQKEIRTENEYSDFEYYLVPTRDFRYEIMKEGADLKVLEPKAFQEEVATELKKAIKRYSF